MPEGQNGFQPPVEEEVPSDILRAEVWSWAERIGVEPREVHIRPMTRKWASCSSAGRLTFSRDLLTQPATFRAEVIAHELLHLKVPNHGPLFRNLLRAYLAEREKLDREADSQTLPAQSRTGRCR